MVNVRMVDALKLWWTLHFFFFWQAKGGGLAFLQGKPSSLEQNDSGGNAQQAFLVYINGDHEYVLFDLYGNDENELRIPRVEGLFGLEETGGLSFSKTFTILVETV